MANHYFTVEDLMLDESFIAYCLKRNQADISYWESTIDSHPGSRKIFDEAEQLVKLLHSGLTEAEIDTELKQIQEKILSQQSFEQNRLQDADINVYTPQRKRNGSKKWLYAGIAASLLTCALLFFGSNNKKDSRPAPVSVVSVAGREGTRKRILLPDGTEVYLNGSSNISWDESFNCKDRNISLSGSAFFKVAKNAEKPFTVHSGALSTTALGTEFYVQQLPSGSDVKVSLLEGKIDVEQKGNKIQNIVYPGEEIIYNTGSRSLRKQKFDVFALQRWLGGELSFSNMKLKDVLDELSFWYNVNVRLQNASLSDKLMTGKYQDAALNDVLKVMSFSLHFTYISSGNTIIIQ